MKRKDKSQGTAITSQIILDREVWLKKSKEREMAKKRETPK